MYKCSLERMSDKIKTFSQFGDAGHGGITRYSLSPEAKMARAEFIKRMKAIGAEIEYDDLANIYATLQELIRTLRESSQDLTVTPLKTVVTTTVSWVL